MVAAPARIWFGLFAAPAAWTIQGLAGWGLGARICQSWPLGIARTAAGIITAVALALALVAMATCWRTWREFRPVDARAESGVAFLAFAGVFVSGVLAIGIFWSALNPLLLQGCGAMR